MRSLRRKWGLPTAVLVIDAMLLFGAVGVGLRISSLISLSSLPRSAALQYPAVRGRVAPLRGGFIASILGALDRGGRSPAALAASAGGGGSVVAESGPTSILAAGTDGARPPAVTSVDGNDDFSSAARIPLVPWAGRADTSRATRESDEPAGCAPIGGSLWFRYAPTTDQRLVAYTSAGGSTALGMFVGSSLGDLRQIGCKVAPGGNAALPLNAHAGQTYSFQVVRPAGGWVVFHLEPRPSIVLASVPDGGATCTDASKSGCSYHPRGSWWPSISANGSIVAFRSDTPLVRSRPQSQCAGMNCTDVYVRNLRSNRTIMADVSSSGEPANNSALIGPPPYSISANGRFVTFWSLASNLVPGDTNQCRTNWPNHERTEQTDTSCADIFVHDLRTGKTERVSVASDGTEANGPSFDPSISPDGRYVAFLSYASNLVHGDDNVCLQDPTNNYRPQETGVQSCPDVFLHDRQTGKTTLVDVSMTGEEAQLGVAPGAFTPGTEGPPDEEGSGRISVSRGGRYVAFASYSSDLVPGDTNEAADVFVRDMRRQNTIRASLRGRRRQWADGSYAPALSPNGRFVVFSGLEPMAKGACAWAYQPYCSNIYIRDLRKGITRRVSIGRNGEEPDGSSNFGQPTPDGRFVVFYSLASNLVDGDSPADPQCNASDSPNNCIGADVFVRDMRLSPSDSGPPAIVRISVTPAGGTPNGASSLAAMTPDARYVAFESGATDLVRGEKDPGGDILDARSGIFVYDRGAPADPHPWRRVARR